MKNKPELLVPAGGEKQFIAAVENGADAIYVGGNLYNARINADNFDESKMQEAIDFAHRRGVKVFVTMNTLVRDDEIAGALDYAKFLYEAGADALIIQDLGLGSVIKKYLPDFELHLSTQASVCDVESLKVAKSLGYKRVVLARELGLDEIKILCASKHCDIEVFVHGAMCICYSGQCQLSRFYGGRSGNRGQCAQPCRLPYKSYRRSESGEYELIGDAAPHPLSPRDMCQIDNLGELIDAGVLSFKIEGRMKSPEYVAVVTRIYRKYIDAYLENGTYTVSREDRDELLQIFNRGEFTEGYMYGDPKARLMSETIPKNQGILAGEVVAYNRGTKLVNIKLYKDIAMHDGLEFHQAVGSAGDRPGGIVTFCKDLGNGVVQVGDFAGRISKGDLVYRTSRRAQLEAARASFEGKTLLDDSDRKPIRKLPVDCKLVCYGGKLVMSMQADGARASVEAGPFEYSEDRATPYDRYQASILKTGNTPYEIRNIRFDGDFNIVVKASEINALRREALEALGDKLCVRRKASDFAYVPCLEQFEQAGFGPISHTLGDIKPGCTAGFELNAYNSETVRVLKELGAKAVIPSLEAVDYDRDLSPYPLMLSKHVWTADRFVSPMGHDLTVVRDDNGGPCKLVATDRR